MPELPEVQTVVDTLRPRLVGLTIRRARLNRADIVQPPGAKLARYLKTRVIRAIDRRGKRIIFTLDNAERFYIHLGMTGQLTVADSPRIKQLPHTHLTIDMNDGRQLRFRDSRRFGGVWWLGSEGAPDSGMGPEPLRILPKQLAERLSRTRRAIKTALLDQNLLAGLGNIYADEALFSAGIHPITPADSLTSRQISRLTRSIKVTLKGALRHRGSTLRDYIDANGSSGRYQDRHLVYGRTDKPCRRCTTLIKRISLGGRSSHFCPRCQPFRNRFLREGKMSEKKVFAPQRSVVNG